MSNAVRTSNSNTINILHDLDTQRNYTADSNELLLFAFEYPPVSGGIARLCAGISDMLQRECQSARVLTQESAAPIVLPALPEVRVDARRPIREWQAFRWLRRRAKKAPEGGLGIICGVWYPEGLIAYLSRVRPLVVLAHGAELLPPANRLRRSLWKAVQRRVLESANLVIANSEYTKNLVSRSAPKTRVEAIPLAVDTDRFAPGDGEAAKTKFGVAGKRVLCSVSRIERYKAHDTVLRAIANLALDEREQLVYLVVGEGSYEQALRELAVELGIEAQVRWLGFVSEEELPQVYRASDLFALCTRDAPEERAVEGFGLVFLEAQSCGTPVVGTRTGGIPAAIREGEGGWLIEQDDNQELTNIIRQLVRSPQLFRTEGAKARQRILRECTWEYYGRRLALALKGAGIPYGKPTSPWATSVTAQQNQGVSIVVPTLNRGSYLIDTLHDLLAQDYSPIEILVVDQSSEEDPALLDLVLKHPQSISHHRVPFRGLPRARNYGWQRAKYEVIVFVDDDVRCGSSLVREHLRGLSQPNIGMVAGGIDEGMSFTKESWPPGQFNSWTATPVRNFRANEQCLVQHVPGCNFSVHRSVLRAAGGFDEALGMGAALYEETDLCLRVQRRGFLIYFNGRARLKHLAAGNGGCRVPDLPRYLESLAHNRAILIGRHLRPIQIPFAYFRLLLLFISYATHYRTMDIFAPGITGFLNGVKTAKQSPVCTEYAPWVRA
jgi:phosphatidyl-myo-inositol dimannoside synthase